MEIIYVNTEETNFETSFLTIEGFCQNYFHLYKYNTNIDTLEEYKKKIYNYMNYCYTKPITLEQSLLFIEYIVNMYHFCEDMILKNTNRLSIEYLGGIIKGDSIKFKGERIIKKINVFLEKLNYKIEQIEEDKFIIIKSDELLENITENEKNKNIKEYIFEYQSNNLQTKNIEERIKVKKELLFLIYKNKDGLEKANDLLDKLVNKCDVRHGIDEKNSNKDVKYFREHYSNEEKEKIYDNIFRYMLYLLDNYDEKIDFLKQIQSEFEENRKKYS